jgi:RNA polymerase primary sigma factor
VSHVDIEDDLDPIAQIDERVSHAADIADSLESLIELPGLGSRAVTVLEMRFGLTGQDPMTLDEIGKHFGVTRERIRQIEKKSLVALRERAEQDHGATHR